MKDEHVKPSNDTFLESSERCEQAMAQKIQAIQHPSPGHMDHAEMPVPSLMERELKPKKLFKINGST